MSGRLICGLLRLVFAAGLLPYGAAFIHAGDSAGKALDDQGKSAAASDGSAATIDRGGFSDTEKPPWPANTDTPQLLSEPFENPRQLLRLLDIGESQLGSFVDGQPLGDDDQEALIRILYRVPQIDKDSIHRWQETQVPWQELMEHPSDLRADYYLIRGRISNVQEQTLSERLSELFKFDHYYRVTLTAGDTDDRIVVCVREIPRAWLRTSPVSERVRVSAMFLKVGASSDDATEFIFAAQRIAWLPDRVDPQMHIGESHVLLGDLDMDVGLFEFPQKRNRLPIDESERECFYELLAATSDTNLDQMTSVAEAMDLASLLQAPQRWHGRVVTIRGSVRRITQVLVEEPDIRDRFGIEHYYQLDVLVPLGEQRIEVQNQQGKAGGPIYQNSFPFTFCCTRLPESWQEFVGKERMNEPMVTPGFFFKLWSYPSAYVAAYDTSQRQLSPMFIAIQPESPVAPKSFDRTSGWMIGVGFLGALAFLWMVVWRLNHSDRKFMRDQVRRRFQADESVRLDDLEP
jgi:hypothetical protein